MDFSWSDEAQIHFFRDFSWFDEAPKQFLWILPGLKKTLKIFMDFSWSEEAPKFFSWILPGMLKPKLIFHGFVLLWRIPKPFFYGFVPGMVKPKPVLLDSTWFSSRKIKNSGNYEQFLQVLVGILHLELLFWPCLEWIFWDFPSFFLLGAEGDHKSHYFPPLEADFSHFSF